ncbi:hypothetical protein BJY16_002962 [Actinoplanes octamycinicus]|uniref:DUF4878 domain-containing protein n=1 Tax=Actinoplanes octamycinicus TaxID=135948 RepID=A0A7W7M770_9ACTN|nr:hypothetical protein [Actinoplanes octamycinicus]MBB4739503.1 hypothetical protein [Actinoplanes octamycinicus]GIE54686.1 hypothetical protein Aoc01nite_00880 [Actinoplanes octamycinicus]
MAYGQPPFPPAPPVPPAVLAPPPPVAPPPPPGPGVHPPFPAPPVEGRGRRIGLGFGIGGGIVALVCGGGLAAVIGLGIAMTSAVNEQAHVVVSDYLDAVHDKDYDKAYDQLCQEAKSFESRERYKARIAREEQFDSYTIGDVDLVSGEVPVDLTYPDGDVDHLSAQLGSNTSTGGFQVCSIGE